MRTCVRVRVGVDTPRRPRRLLRLGRTARRSATAGPARHRGRRCGAGRELRGQATRCAHGDDGRRARRLCPEAVVVAPRMDGLRRGQQARCSTCSTTRRPLVEGLSIDEAFLDVGWSAPAGGHPARDRRAPAPRRGRPGRPARSPSASPARSSWPRWPAPSPSPTACCSWTPTTSSASSTRFRSSACGASARSPPPSCVTGGSRTVADVAPLGESALAAIIGRASGRHLHALAHNRDPRPVQTGRRRRSIGAQHAIGSRPRRSQHR